MYNFFFLRIIYMADATFLSVEAFSKPVFGLTVCLIEKRILWSGPETRAYFTAAVNLDYYFKWSLHNIDALCLTLER